MAKYPYDINERCLILRLTPELAALPFSCGSTEGDKDLEDFFHNQAIPFSAERLGQTYCVIDNNGEISMQTKRQNARSNIYLRMQKQYTPVIYS